MHEDARAEALFDAIIAGDHRDDPYPGYADLRTAAPVLLTSADTLVLSRFADCDVALRHKSLGKSGRILDPTPGAGGSTTAGRSMLFTDPPEHARLRRPVSGLFTAQRMERLRSDVVVTTRRLFDRLDGTCDFVSEIALPLPVAVIAGLVGVPAGDRASLTPYIHDLTALLDPHSTDDALARAATARDELAEYFGGLIVEKRANPDDTLLSSLLAGGPGGAIDDIEVIATAIVLFGAGFETTVNLLGNGLLALLNHPDQFETLRRQPALLPSAIEEMLRFDAPIQLNGRSVIAPTVLAGVDIEPGDVVVTVLGAANRDPARFTDPESFDITRSEGTHLAFSAGVHYCLGAHLARVEAAAVVTELLSRFSHVALAGEPVRAESTTIRGLASLPITVAR